MEPLKITKANFEKEVMQSTVPVIIDFYADWCGPCKMQAPIMAELAEEVTNAKICKLNVDEESQIASSFSVMSIPTIVVIKDGKLANRAVGLQSKAKLLAMIN